MPARLAAGYRLRVAFLQLSPSSQVAARERRSISVAEEEYVARKTKKKRRTFRCVLHDADVGERERAGANAGYECERRAPAHGNSDQARDRCDRGKPYVRPRVCHVCAEKSRFGPESAF